MIVYWLQRQNDADVDDTDSATAASEAAAHPPDGSCTPSDSHGTQPDNGHGTQPDSRGTLGGVSGGTSTADATGGSSASSSSRVE